MCHGVNTLLNALNMEMKLLPLSSHRVCPYTVTLLSLHLATCLLKRCFPVFVPSVREGVKIPRVCRTFLKNASSFFTVLYLHIFSILCTLKSPYVTEDLLIEVFLIDKKPFCTNTMCNYALLQNYM